MTWPVGTAVQSELDALHAECAALRAERDEAVALLRAVSETGGLANDLVRDRVDTFLAKVKP